MKRILLVDDQELYLTSLAFALGNHFQIQVAYSLNSALELLKGEVDIAVIDIRLDEKDDNNADGLKILEWINLNRPDISVFMMSAYREFSYAEQALNMGAKHFFRKPIDIRSFLAILKEKG